MGFFRRRRESEPELPADLASLPAEQRDWWARRLVYEATERGAAAAPAFVAKVAKVSLVYVCGEERASALPEETLMLGFNVALLGYWVRVTELDRLGVADGSRLMTEVLRAARKEELYGIDWWATVAGFSYNLADSRPESRESMADVRSDSPAGLGEDFRSQLLSTSLMASVEPTSDGASGAPTEAEWCHCWCGGYWLRVVESSLPPEAQKELGKVRLGG